jgi:hypothetical protein
LLTMRIAPGPGLSTVLTGSGPAMFPTGSYSPLLGITVMKEARNVKGKNMGKIECRRSA